MKFSKHRKWITAAAMTAALATTVLTGCTSSSSPSASEPTSSVTNAVLDGSATLRVGSVFPSTTLDPAKMRSNSDIAFLGQLYDRLFKLDSELKVVPMLAESASWSEDRSTLTLTLRDDVTFHDGTAFDSAVVKANLESKKSNGSPAVLSAVSAIESVETPTPTSVVLTIAEGRGADIMLGLAEGAGFMVSLAGLTSTDLETVSSGSGPYILGEVQAGSSVTFDKAESYWGGGQEDRPAEIVAITFADNTTLLNAFQSGDVDVVLSDDNSRVQTMIQEPNTQSHVASQIGSYRISFNHQSEAVQDLKVRQAIAHSIDREALSLGAFDGQCAPTAQLATQGSELYDPALEELYPFDIEQAKELLTEAGYPDGITLEGLMISAPPFDKIAEIVQGMLSESNINVDYRTTTVANNISTWGDGQSDFLIFAGSVMANPEIGVEAITRNVQHSTLPFGTTVVVQEASEGFADSRLTSEDHEDVLRATNEAITEDVGTVFLCSFDRVIMAHDNIVGYEDIPNAYRGGFDFSNMRVVDAE